MEDKGKRIAVLGGGSSGIAAARLALAGGALVWVFDTADAGKFSETRSDLEASGIEMRCGEDALKAPDNIDLIVVSPGIDRGTPLVRSFLETGAPMVSEIEFAFQRDDRPVVAITGTNGKTTTTELLTHFLNASGRRTVAAGNYGKPYSEVAMETDAWDVVALEVSSFQLEEIDTFRPEVSVWMNFAPDHMDRYRSLDEYRQAKLRIFENQTSADTAIVKAEESLEGIKARQIRFSAFCDDADFTYKSGKISLHGEELVDFKLSKLHGRHNAENVMAALAAVKALGLPIDSMQQALCQYDPPAHRCEKVGEIGGVSFINDSKATNLHALESSLRGQEAGVVLIAGGKDKGLDYSEITQVVVDHVSQVFAIGEIAENISRDWQDHLPCKKAESLKQAVELAMEAADADQVVLFSPGTSSFDMFSGYIERGETFRKIVSEIKTQAGEQV
ncbi:MAG: UDP-N-acetylmuramoyl-L-alanine--D-glutamate ligase [Verrucomicrobia bacterium]|nr:UDP-N-acetylmuramoyl-L-alanine--D-glutamate ligase [Verrucomicrobiota bacterium]